MVLGSWWEISENGDRGFTQNFDTDLVSIVVWPGKPLSEKCSFWPYFQNYHVHFSRNEFPNWIFPHALNSPDPAARPSVPPVPRHPKYKSKYPKYKSKYPKYKSKYQKYKSKYQKYKSKYPKYKSKYPKINPKPITINPKSIKINPKPIRIN